ncbi:HAD-IB family hydrolase [Okibacterium endophyticum]
MSHGTTTAFFDVDGTLISAQSLTSFLMYYTRTPGGRTVAARVAGLQELVDAGAGRSTVNRAYFRAFAGEHWDALLAAGNNWYTSLDESTLFHRPVLDRLIWHYQSGHRIVLVSGSWAPCLEPLATVLSATVLCSQPTIVDGVLTGELDVQMLGSTKANAMQALHKTHPVDWQTSTAYGDDISDLPMLELVGRPAVVGRNAPLLHHATTNRWERIVW